MKTILYGVSVQFKMDLRSNTLLVTCYAVPLLFFLIMGGIFTSLMPEAKQTLIPAMSIMGISMGAFIGVPPSMVEIYATDIKKMYMANKIPLSFGVITLGISAFIHLMITSILIFIFAPIMFHAAIPSNIPHYFITLALFIIVSLTVACVLGLGVKSQAKLTMYIKLFSYHLLCYPVSCFPQNYFPTHLKPSVFSFLQHGAIVYLPKAIHQFLLIFLYASFSLWQFL